MKKILICVSIVAILTLCVPNVDIAATGDYSTTFRNNMRHIGDCIVTARDSTSNGIVYVGSDDRNLYALDAVTGAKLWNFTTGNLVLSETASPAVANGIVYIRGGITNYNLYALDANTGTKVWNYTRNWWFSPPTVANGIVYVGNGDGNVYALDANTGAKIWSYTIGNGVIIISFSSPTVANGIVYVGCNDHNLYALDANTGAKVWSYTTGDIVLSKPAIANGIVYIGSGDSNVYALNANTGMKVWSCPISLFLMRTSPAVSNGIVYIGSDDHNIYALDVNTGTKIWNYTTGDAVISSPTVANGIVYVGSDDNNVYALNATTGAKLWACWTPNRVESSPTVANGIVYVGSDDYNVYAINASTGGKVWSYRTGGKVESSPTATVNAIVYSPKLFGPVSITDVKLVPEDPRSLMWEVACNDSGYTSVAPIASLYATDPTSSRSPDERDITAQYVYDTVTKTLSNTTISFGYGWAQIKQGHTYLFISPPVVPSDAKWAVYNARAWYDGKSHDSLFVPSPCKALR